MSQKNGGGFFQNGGITESIFNVIVTFLNAAGGGTDGRTYLILVPKCPFLIYL